MEPYKYYLKKLTANELGYRKGKLSTGQMFYISKSATSFFPPLRSEVLNDTVSLEITVEYHPHPIHANLVYHNDKYNQEKGTRDEYRIYLNRDLAPDDFYFRPDDIIIFERVSTIKYYLSKTRTTDPTYFFLKSVLDQHKSGTSHKLLTESEGLNLHSIPPK